jgi:hypothetical protein
MQGLSLIHAGFLTAGLAVALPIVIHLLFRQRTRTVPIGSVRFLHQVVREHRRRRRVRQWLLLSLRMIAVLLLVLLFCRPYWDQSHLRGLEQEVVFLLDRSASMQARDSGGESSWDRAVAAAKAELSQLDENVILHVAVCDAAEVVELPMEQVTATMPSESATDFGLAFSWAGDILAASNRATRRIVLVSDLQQNGLPREPLERLPDGVELDIRDVGDPLPRNVAIESATAVRTEIRPDNPVSVRVILKNHGPIPVRNLKGLCEVENRPGDRLSADWQSDIPGHGNAVFELPLKIEKDGLYRGRVAIAVEDALALDNTRWIAFEARHPDRVLLVDGQEGRSIFSNETYFLETALRLRTEEASGQTRSFEVDRIVWEAGEGFPRLEGYRAVVLANVRRLTAEDGRRMDSFVRNGGSLLIFAGDQVGSQSLAVLQERGLLPGHVGEASIEGRLRVERWDVKHPALACFNDPQQGDLRRVVFQRVLPLKSLEPDSAELLGSGDLIIAAERQMGKGRCLYFGSTADRDWTELPRSPMYVPLMRQLLAYLTDQLAERSAITNLPVGRLQQTAGITPLDGDGEHWLVTNIDPRESRMERVTSEELMKLAGTVPTETPDETSSVAGLTLPADALRPDEIWTTVAWILFAVLAAEILLAGRVHS